MVTGFAFTKSSLLLLEADVLLNSLAFRRNDLERMSLVMTLAEWLNSSEFSGRVLPLLISLDVSLVRVNVPVALWRLVVEDFRELMEGLILEFDQIVVFHVFILLNRGLAG